MAKQTGKSNSKTVKSQFGNITVNMSALVREDKLDGKDYLVAPVILAKECVMNGLLYPGEQLAKSCAAWNGRISVVFHPTDENGTPICANQKEVIEKQTVGLLLNTVYDSETTKLKSELWLEKGKVAKVSPRLQELIDNGSNVEVSTGLFLDVNEQEGEFNGKKYHGIAVNYRPDHLALLPDGKGACSWDDGAGFPRTNAKSVHEIVQDALSERSACVTVNEMSHDELRTKLCGLLPASDENTWHYIRDVYDTNFIYEKSLSGSGMTLYKQAYAMDAKDEPSLVGEPIKVQIKIEYVPITNQETKKMDRKQVIDGLITNKLFEETDRAFLEALTDDQLKKVSATAEVKPATNADTTPAPAKTPAPEVKPVVNTETVPATNATEDEATRYGKILYKREKDRLITNVKSNPANAFTDDQLSKMDLETLENVSRLATPVDMTGAGGRPTGNAAAPTVEVLAAPTFATKQ